MGAGVRCTCAYSQGPNGSDSTRAWILGAVAVETFPRFLWEFVALHALLATKDYLRNCAVLPGCVAARVVDYAMVGRPCDWFARRTPRLESAAASTIIDLCREPASSLPWLLLFG